MLRRQSMMSNLKSPLATYGHNSVILSLLWSSETVVDPFQALALSPMHSDHFDAVKDGKLYARSYIKRPLLVIISLSLNQLSGHTGPQIFRHRLHRFRFNTFNMLKNIVVLLCRTSILVYAIIPLLMNSFNGTEKNLPTK